MRFGFFCMEDSGIKFHLSPSSRLLQNQYFNPVCYRLSSWKLELGKLMFYSLLGATVIMAFQVREKHEDLAKQVSMCPSDFSPVLWGATRAPWVDPWLLSGAYHLQSEFFFP